jgi:putative nucleotidyltransferase with HDIG domain
VEAATTPHPNRALAGALALLLPGSALLAVVPKEGIGHPLFFVLLALDIVGSRLITRLESSTFITANFASAMLAVAFLGPGAAFLVVVIGTTTAWLIDRYRWRVLFVNLGITATPVLLTGVAFRAAVDVHAVDPVFLTALGVLGAAAFCVNIFLLATLMATIDGYAIAPALKATRAFAPAVGLNVGFLVAAAGIYGKFGFGASAVIVLVVAAFGYMLHLVAVARERTKQYANLSWGILSGLVRTLDERDSRAARHCAAVAAFSRDMAAAVGMSKRDQELAHTAGLLHDIGKFALSDRVMERGGRLTDADWRGIRRHPEIGANLLKDLGVYGPVAEIVRAHHERIDGRGYPDRLTGDQIPELAKIVAVAEVYDTLTAPDTYRTPMNSFEALNELRRVAGSQLDERYVEVLAELLAGKGTEYRHADEADFDAELDIERRMNEAAAP